MTHITLEQVRCALGLKLPDFDPRAAQFKMSPQPRPVMRPIEVPGNPRRAGTLMLLFPIDERLHFVLTRRPETLPNHAGQISLPGGRQHEGETFQEAAIRETCEEIGVCDPIEILGELTDIYIPPSDFLVYPFVGYLPQRPVWNPQEHEVAEIIECPLDLLLDDSVKAWGKTKIREFEVDIGWYLVKDYQVWGATAIMLSEMEWRLRACIE